MDFFFCQTLRLKIQCVFDGKAKYAGSGYNFLLYIMTNIKNRINGRGDDACFKEREREKNVVSFLLRTSFYILIFESNTHYYYS